MQATVATLCTVLAVGRAARATETQKRIYANAAPRLKDMFAACNKATEVSAKLATLPPGSVFQVYATGTEQAIAIEGVRGFASVLGRTLSSALTLTLPRTGTIIPILTLTLGAYKASMGKPQDGWSKYAFADITSVHLIDPEVEMDLPFVTPPDRRRKPDSALSNVLEILERTLVRSERFHRPHTNPASLPIRPQFHMRFKCTLALVGMLVLIMHTTPHRLTYTDCRNQESSQNLGHLGSVGGGGK